MGQNHNGPIQDRPPWATTSKSAYTITIRRLPTCNIFTLNGYSDIYPMAVFVAEIPVVAELTGGINGPAA